MGEQIYTQTQFSFHLTTDNRVQLDFIRIRKRTTENEREREQNEVLSLSVYVFCILLTLLFSRLRQLLTEERREQLQKN